MSQRIFWVDNLKGFLIILVVLGHVIQSAIDANIDSFCMKNFFDWIYSFHMPLFFAISGFVYSLTLRKILFSNEFWYKWKKRIYTLGYLYFMYSSIMWGLKYFLFTEGVKESVDFMDLLLMPIYPISVYWFLYVLLGIFLIVPVIEKKICLFNYKILFFLIVLQCISTYVEFPLYLNRLFYMLPFFVGGMFIKHTSMNYVCILALIFGYVLSFHLQISARELKIIHGFILGMIFIEIFKKYIDKEMFIVTFLGKNCLSIYLFHAYAVAFLKNCLAYIGYIGWPYVIGSFWGSLVVCAIIIYFNRYNCVRRVFYLGR